MLPVTTFGRMCPRRARYNDQTPTATAVQPETVEDKQSIKDRLVSAMEKCFKEVELSPQERLSQVEKQSYPVQEILYSAGVLRGAYTLKEGNYAFGTMAAGLSLWGVATALQQHIAYCRQQDPKDRTTAFHRTQLMINGVFLLTLTLSEVEELKQGNLEPLESVSKAMLSAFGAYSVVTLLNHYNRIVDFNIEQAAKSVSDSRTIMV